MKDFDDEKEESLSPDFTLGEAGQFVVTYNLSDWPVELDVVRKATDDNGSATTGVKVVVNEDKIITSEGEISNGGTLENPIEVALDAIPVSVTSVEDAVINSAIATSLGEYGWEVKHSPGGDPDGIEWVAFEWGDIVNSLSSNELVFKNGFDVLGDIVKVGDKIELRRARVKVELSGGEQVYARKKTEEAVFEITAPLAIQDIDISSVKMFPNPAIKSVNIAAKGFENVEIFNALGQSVTKLKVAEQMSINTSSYVKGVYYVKFTSEKETITKRLIIK
ncbi:MAG: T9SS type A sorting domain-containing protein [Bacteroidota bacterium]